MQKSVIGMTTNRGFTLIEILVVMVIIGITIGFALIAFGDFGASRRLQFAAEQLANKIKLVQQQAILESATYGLNIDKKNYQFFKFNNNSAWISLNNKGIYKITYFPQSSYIHLKTAAPTGQNTPAIIIHPSGDMTAFSLHFGSDKNTVSTVLEANTQGELSFKAVPVK